MNALEEHKGEDILLLDVRSLAPFTDYFVICSGNTDRLLDALADSAREAARKQYHVGARTEGTPQSGWILLDFGDVVVHLFSPDLRDYYRLEDLWADGKVVLHLQ